MHLTRNIFLIHLLIGMVILREPKFYLKFLKLPETATMAQILEACKDVPLVLPQNFFDSEQYIDFKLRQVEPCNYFRNNTNTLDDYHKMMRRQLLVQFRSKHRLFSKLQEQFMDFLPLDELNYLVDVVGNFYNTADSDFKLVQLHKKKSIPVSELNNMKYTVGSLFVFKTENDNEERNYALFVVDFETNLDKKNKVFGQRYLLDLKNFHTYVGEGVLELPKKDGYYNSQDDKDRIIRFRVENDKVILDTAFFIEKRGPGKELLMTIFLQNDTDFEIHDYFSEIDGRVDEQNKPLEAFPKGSVPPISFGWIQLGETDLPEYAKKESLIK